MPINHPHYLVITAGTAGDIHPFLRIAKSFQALDRKVTFITNTYHARMLAGSGLPFIGIGTDEDYLRAIQNPDIWDERKGFAALFANYGEQLLQIHATIQSVAEDSPKVVIAHPLIVPGAAISRELGFVQGIVSLYLAPGSIKTCHDPVRMGSTTLPRWFPMRWRKALWRFVEKGWIDPVPLGQINEARRRLNLKTIHTSLLSHMESTPDLTVALFPEWFGPTMPDWPKPLLRGDFQLYEADDSQQLSPELAAFLATGEKPLVFTPGTGHIHAAEFFSSAVAATSRLGRRAIFLTREKNQVPAQLPETILWQPYVPLAKLLPQSAALIHHGGIGTTAEALRAGTPQLVVPFGWDQFDNGARVAELGAGKVIPAKRLKSGNLASTLSSILRSDEIRSRGDTSAAHFAQAHDPVRLCAEIDRRVMASA